MQQEVVQLPVSGVVLVLVNVTTMSSPNSRTTVAVPPIAVLLGVPPVSDVIADPAVQPAFGVSTMVYVPGVKIPAPSKGVGARPPAAAIVKPVGVAGGTELNVKPHGVAGGAPKTVLLTVMVPGVCAWALEPWVAMADVTTSAARDSAITVRMMTEIVTGFAAP